jgi:hypothetical protein
VLQPGQPWLATTACAAAWIMATGPGESLLDGEEGGALREVRARATRADDALEVLAAAYARAGDFESAALAQEQVGLRAQNADQKRLMEERLQLYRAGKAYTRTR